MSLLALLTAVTLTFHTNVTNKETGETALNTCTAVFISPNEALTARHCIHGDKSWVKDADNKSFSATLVRMDSTQDLALIQVIGIPHKYAQLGKPVQKGEKIYLYSSEDDMIGTYGEGTVENIVIDQGVPMIVHSASILPGGSGSGLFNSKGELVGINTITMGSLSKAVDMTAINYFLGRVRLEQHNGSREGRISLLHSMKQPFLLEFQLPQSIASFLLN